MRHPEADETPKTMSSGRTGTRSSARPVAARIAMRVLDEIAEHRRHVEHRREQVIGERRVPHGAVLQLDLLHHREPETLRDPPFKLPDHRERVDRLADVLRRRDLDDLHQTRVHVDVDDRAVRGEQERDVSVVLGRVVALLGWPMAMGHDALGRRIEQLGELDLVDALAARSSSLRKLGLHLTTRREHGAAGHPCLTRRRRRAGRTDRRIRCLDDDPLHTQLRACDLLAHEHDPLPHL